MSSKLERSQASCAATTEMTCRSSGVKSSAPESLPMFSTPTIFSWARMGMIIADRGRWFFRREAIFPVINRGFPWATTSPGGDDGELILLEEHDRPLLGAHPVERTVEIPLQGPFEVFPRHKVGRGVDDPVEGSVQADGFQLTRGIPPARPP